MKILLVTEAAAAELAALNESAPSGRCLEPMRLADGRQFLGADLLGDCGPEGTWTHYAETLGRLELAEISAEDIAKPGDAPAAEASETPASAAPVSEAVPDAAAPAALKRNKSAKQ